MTGLRSVLFVVPRFHTNLFFATRALAAHGVRVTLWVLETADGEDHSIVAPVVIPEAERGFAAVRQRLAALDPDLVVLRDVGPLSKSVFLSGSLQRRRILAYDQKPYLRPPRPPFAGLQSLVRGKPQRRITPVRGLGGAGAVPDPLAAYVPFPVDAQPADASPRTYAPGGRVRILSVGKLTQPRKNHLVLLDALAALAPRHAFSLTLAGAARTDIKDSDSALFERIRARLAAPPLAGRATVAADVPFRDMAALYRAHDIVVLAADREPLGSAPVEGMAWGAVPAISTGCGSAGYVHGGAAGVTFAPNDAGALAAALEPLLASSDRLRAAGEAAADVARSELSAERFVSRLAAAARGPR
jgi:glycosyltransferase involved in cell wall biosynthesis